MGALAGVRMPITSGQPRPPTASRSRERLATERRIQALTGQPSWERAESHAMPSQRGIRRQGPSRKPAEAPCSLRVEHGSGGTDSGCWLHEPTGDPCPGAMASPTREPRGAAGDRSRGRPHAAGPSGLRTARATQSGTSWLACRPQCAHQQNVVRATAQLQRRRRPADGDLRLTPDSPAVRERRATPTTAPSQRPTRTATGIHHRSVQNVFV
jgi:hypothetical protein